MGLERAGPLSIFVTLNFNRACSFRRFSPRLDRKVRSPNLNRRKEAVKAFK